MATEDPNTLSSALTIPQAAEDGKVGRSTLYKDMKSGRLRAKKIGRRTIILRPDWDAYLAALPAYRPQSSAETKSGDVDAGQKPDDGRLAGNATPVGSRSRGGGR